MISDCINSYDNIQGEVITLLMQVVAAAAGTMLLTFYLLLAVKIFSFVLSLVCVFWRCMPQNLADNCSTEEQLTMQCVIQLLSLYRIELSGGICVEGHV